MTQPPPAIDGFLVLEYGFLLRGALPLGYRPSDDGRPAQEPMQNFAVCEAEGVEGFYLLCCTPDWRCMTYCFDEDIEGLKFRLLAEFGLAPEPWYSMKPPDMGSIPVSPAEGQIAARSRYRLKPPGGLS